MKRRANLFVSGAIAAICGGSLGAAESFPPQRPGNELTVAQVSALGQGVYTHTELTVGSNRVLLVTRDMASGIERRDAYFYVCRGDSWSLFAYRDTNSSKLSMRVRAGALELVTKAGKTILSMPIDSIDTKYDPKEQ